MLACCYKSGSGSGAYGSTRATWMRRQNPRSRCWIPTDRRDFWHATVRQLVQAQAITAMVRELALQAQLVARDTDQWLLRVERESLNQPGSRDRLAQALAQLGQCGENRGGSGARDRCPARRNSQASAERQLAAEKIIFDNPFVQAMMRDFGAKIVPGSIKPV